jgi:DNA-binding PucR family transcriptional regulator
MDASGDNRDAFELEFVTHSNVESLGAFILDLLGEAKHESERDDELIELLKNYES